jgi:hypothetical protein
MRAGIKIFFLTGFFFSCVPQRVVYRAPDLDSDLINVRYVGTQKAVHLLFYVRKNEMRELDGVIKSASKEAGITFEYFNSETHQLMEATIPLQNIYEISVTESNYDKNQKIIHFTLGGLALVILALSVIR